LGQDGNGPEKQERILVKKVNDKESPMAKEPGKKKNRKHGPKAGEGDLTQE